MDSLSFQFDAFKLTDITIANEVAILILQFKKNDKEFPWFRIKVTPGLCVSINKLTTVSLKTSNICIGNNQQ